MGAGAINIHIYTFFIQAGGIFSFYTAKNNILNMYFWLIFLFKYLKMIVKNKIKQVKTNFKSVLQLNLILFQRFLHIFTGELLIY